MTNKSPRLPRKAFTLPGPPAPPNSPALLGGKLPAPPKQDSFALRVVEGIEDAALVEIKCDAPATKTAVDVMVVLDISGSMSTECKVQGRVGQSAEARLLDPRRLQARDAGARRDAGRRLETGSDHVRQRRGAGAAFGKRRQGPRERFGVEINRGAQGCSQQTTR